MGCHASVIFTSPIALDHHAGDGEVALFSYDRELAEQAYHCWRCWPEAAWRKQYCGGIFVHLLKKPNVEGTCSYGAWTWRVTLFGASAAWRFFHAAPWVQNLKRPKVHHFIFVLWSWTSTWYLNILPMVSVFLQQVPHLSSICTEGWWEARSKGWIPCGWYSGHWDWHHSQHSVSSVSW